MEPCVGGRTESAAAAGGRAPRSRPSAPRALTSPGARGGQQRAGRARADPSSTPPSSGPSTARSTSPAPGQRSRAGPPARRGQAAARAPRSSAPAPTLRTLADPAEGTPAPPRPRGPTRRTHAGLAAPGESDGLKRSALGPRGRRPQRPQPPPGPPGLQAGCRPLPRPARESHRAPACAEGRGSVSGGRRGCEERAGTSCRRCQWSLSGRGRQRLITAPPPPAPAPRPPIGSAAPRAASRAPRRRRPLSALCLPLTRRPSPLSAPAPTPRSWRSAPPKGFALASLAKPAAPSARSGRRQGPEPEGPHRRPRGGGKPRWRRWGRGMNGAPDEAPAAENNNQARLGLWQLPFSRSRGPAARRTRGGDLGGPPSDPAPLPRPLARARRPPDARGACAAAKKAERPGTRYSHARRRGLARAAGRVPGPRCSVSFGQQPSSLLPPPRRPGPGRLRLWRPEGRPPRFRSWALWA